ncbi:hypothetical protein IB278_15895 [Variovorax sp. VRV01]|uniref:hypothetical protein n=1 Tax=Variovorax sp. VRV01 TaxID=2769259 RepID=UPI001782D4EB|nr:hypothetical protein [Variovorax sp. VRV01]MBD9665455.1 hypothetical protein [Variovorax sp. VRV01]
MNGAGGYQTTETLVIEGRAADVLNLLGILPDRVFWMIAPWTCRLPMAEATRTHDVSGGTGDFSDLLFLDVDGVRPPVGEDYSFSSRFFSHLPLCSAASGCAVVG